MALFPAFQRSRIPDDSTLGDVLKFVREMQAHIVDAIGPLPKLQLVDGGLLTNIGLSSTVTRVNHNLGRRLVGYIVVRRDANATVWNAAVQTMPDRVIDLFASAPVTVDLWVF